MPRVAGEPSTAAPESPEGLEDHLEMGVNADAVTGETAARNMAAIVAGDDTAAPLKPRGAPPYYIDVFDYDAPDEPDEQPPTPQWTAPIQAQPDNCFFVGQVAVDCEPFYWDFVHKVTMLDRRNTNAPPVQRDWVYLYEMESALYGSTSSSLRSTSS